MPSRQHVAFANGQQPYPPPGILQQVVPLGHVDTPPGHVIYGFFMLDFFKRSHKPIEKREEILAAVIS
jgi:hypothetical protein